MSTKTRRKVLIVDDHPMMREGLVQLIAQEADLTVCGQAEGAADALTAVEKAKPDLAIVDISLKQGNGLELIKDLKIRAPALAILVLSMHDESLYAERVLRAGGNGYLMKQEGGKKIMAAIRQVLEGRIYLSNKMSDKILGSLSGHPAKDSGPSLSQLTDREFEVFQLIGHGSGTRDIAGRLYVSVKTVEAHRVNIKQKLGVKTAQELVHFAIRWVEQESSR